MRQRIERSCSNSQIPMCKITGKHQQSKRKRSFDKKQSGNTKQLQDSKIKRKKWKNGK